MGLFDCDFTKNIPMGGFKVVLIYDYIFGKAFLFN